MRSLWTTVASVFVLVVLLAAFDRLFLAVFPTLPRLVVDFSPAYLRREVTRLAGARNPCVILGDSVLWGYKVSYAESAAAKLAGRGFPCANLAFEGGSFPNTYALLRLLSASGVHPRVVVFNVNQKVFNRADSAYNRLQPAVSELARPFLTTAERAQLDLGPAPKDPIDALITAHWSLYAMRSDLRETLFRDADAAHALDNVVKTLSGAAARAEANHRPTPARFEGTYDLTPLSESNVGVIFMRKTAQLLATEHILGIAILTPTNHRLLHDYIDVSAYRSNIAFSKRVLERGGVKVIDADTAFAPNEFIDNDHLTPAGNTHLAKALEHALVR